MLGCCRIAILSNTCTVATLRLKNSHRIEILDSVTYAPLATMSLTITRTDVQVCLLLGCTISDITSSQTWRPPSLPHDMPASNLVTGLKQSVYNTHDAIIIKRRNLAIPEIHKRPETSSVAQPVGYTERTHP